MTKAVVFVPSDDFEPQAEICYCEDRGYQFHGVVRDWARALGMVVGGVVSAIVFSRSGQDRPRDAGVGEQTRRIRPIGEKQIQMTQADVMRLLDSEATIPFGIDPASVAAARRLARHFDECNPN